jgi:hypothetical protein
VRGFHPAKKGDFEVEKGVENQSTAGVSLRSDLLKLAARRAETAPELVVFLYQGVHLVRDHDAGRTEPERAIPQAGIARHCCARSAGARAHHDNGCQETGRCVKSAADRALRVAALAISGCAVAHHILMHTVPGPSLIVPQAVPAGHTFGSLSQGISHEQKEPLEQPANPQ